MPRSWRRLASSLKDSGEETVTMSFDEISTLVGDLPKSEMKKAGFWKNDRGKPQGKAWLDAGYAVEDVDTSGETVTFKRTAAN